MSHIYVMSIMRQHSDRVIFFNFFFVVHDHALNQNVIIIGDIISSVAILLNALLHRINVLLLCRTSVSAVSDPAFMPVRVQGTKFNLDIL